MIKIEIIDAAKENPDTLVKVAGFLMELAGHKMVKAPEDATKEFLGRKLKETEQAIVEHYNNSPSYEELMEEESIIPPPITPPGLHENAALVLNELSAPYQHCGESDLGKEEILVSGRTMLNEDGSIHTIPPHIHEVKKPKSRKKPKGKIEIIKETGVTTVEEDLIAPAPPIENGTIVQTFRKEFPSGVAVKQEEGWVDFNKTGLGEPIVNGNTLIDKIVMATSSGKLTHEEILQIVRKHGLQATRDVFTHDHLIAPINADIDEALRGK